MRHHLFVGSALLQNSQARPDIALVLVVRHIRCANWIELIPKVAYFPPALSTFLLRQARQISLLHRLGTAGDRHHACPRHINQSERAHQPDKGVELFRRARHLENEGGMRRVDHAGAEGI